MKYFNPATEALIWGALETGIGTITKDNYPEVWMRLAMCDGINGKRLVYFDDQDKEWKRRSVTMDEVKAHIGLRTNVFPKETPTKWYKKMLNRVVRKSL